MRNNEMQIDCTSSKYNQTLYVTSGFMGTDQHKWATELTPNEYMNSF